MMVVRVAYWLPMLIRVHLPRLWLSPFTTYCKVFFIKERNNSEQLSV